VQRLRSRTPPLHSNSRSAGIAPCCPAKEAIIRGLTSPLSLPTSPYLNLGAGSWYFISLSGVSNIKDIRLAGRWRIGWPDGWEQ
jgi:hypothetical protein